MATINDGLRKLINTFKFAADEPCNLKTRPELVNAFLAQFVTANIDDADISETLISAVTAQKTIGGKFNALADAAEALKNAGPDLNPSGPREHQ